MSRVREYDGIEDVYDLMNFGRWERNTRATLAGKRGQAVLRELEQALLALPAPRLAADTFCATGEDDAQVEACALGALALYRGVSARVPPEFNLASDDMREDAGVWDAARDEAEWAVAHLGIAYTLAWNIIERNDEMYSRLTPEARWSKMLRWVRANIR